MASSGSVGYALYNRADVAVQSMASSGSVADLLQPQALSGEQTGRVNVLIAGNSADDAGHSGAALTDSIMVASIDVQTKKLTLISVPRDMWAAVNGSSMKLNAVYTVGGMNMLQSRVESMLGITINHYVLINYTAFKHLIDAVGGVDVTIESSDQRGIYDPMMDGFTITNGLHHLNGAQALQLARSRNDPTYDGRIPYGLSKGDFDRAANQRKIMQALLTRLTSSSPVSVSNLPAILKSFEGTVTSNFSTGQLRRVYDLSKEVAATQSISIRGTDQQLLIRDYMVGGQLALIPAAGIDNYEAIKAYVAASTSLQ